jgi:hypothetical protein
MASARFEMMPLRKCIRKDGNMLNNVGGKISRALPPTPLCHQKNEINLDLDLDETNTIENFTLRFNTEKICQNMLISRWFLNLLSHHEGMILG